jgi:hypothetical protein
MPEPPCLAVDRLVLTVPAMAEDEARHLVELVARALREWPVDLAVAGHLEQVTTTVPPAAPASTAGESAEALAARIAEAILADTVRGLA